MKLSCTPVKNFCPVLPDTWTWKWRLPLHGHHHLLGSFSLATWECPHGQDLCATQESSTGYEHKTHSERERAPGILRVIEHQVPSFWLFTLKYLTLRYLKKSKMIRIPRVSARILFQGDLQGASLCLTPLLPGFGQWSKGYNAFGFYKQSQWYWPCYFPSWTSHYQQGWNRKWFNWGRLHCTQQILKSPGAA